jgi:uncharacterized membrane protein YcjF (UPF0283 family)
MIKKIILFISVFFAAALNAQTSAPVMADTLREDGKIYVVIGVIAMIFLSIVILLIMLERRLEKLEDKMKK